MRYLSIIIFVLFYVHTQAQTYLEIFVPLGSSNITQASIDRINGEVPPNNVQWHRGFSKGIETRLSAALSQKLSIKLFLNYMILQNKFSLKEERTSFSWTYREVNARVDEHSIGLGFQFQYDLFQNENHSISTFVRLGGNMLTYHDAYTTEIRANYFSPEEESFEGRESEYSEYEDYYINPGLGLTYSFQINEKFSLFADAAYTYYYNVNIYYARNEMLPIDWNNFYTGLGARLNISSKEKVKDQ